MSARVLKSVLTEEQANRVLELCREVDRAQDDYEDAVEQHAASSAELIQTQNLAAGLMAVVAADQETLESATDLLEEAREAREAFYQEIEVQTLPATPAA